VRGVAERVAIGVREDLDRSHREHHGRAAAVRIAEAAAGWVIAYLMSDYAPPGPPALSSWCGQWDLSECRDSDGRMGLLSLAGKTYSLLVWTRKNRCQGSGLAR
jgi:hypothetical protein